MKRDEREYKIKFFDWHERDAANKRKK